MPEKKSTYYCLNPVRHGGELHRHTIDLTDDEAAPLLDAKSISKHNPADKVDLVAAEKAKLRAEVEAEVRAEIAAETEAGDKAAAEGAGDAAEKPEADKATPKASK